MTSQKPLVTPVSYHQQTPQTEAGGAYAGWFRAKWKRIIGIQRSNQHRMGIPMIKVRRQWHRLIFIMGIFILIRRQLNWYWNDPLPRGAVNSDETARILSGCWESSVLGEGSWLMQMKRLPLRCLSYVYQMFVRWPVVANNFGTLKRSRRHFCHSWGSLIQRNSVSIIIAT